MIFREIKSGIVELKSSKKAPTGWQVTNLYLIGIKEKILIDTGYPDNELVYELKNLSEKENFKLKKIILTHGHIDHSSNLKELKDAFSSEIIAFEKEKPIFERRKRHTLIDRWINEEINIKTELGDLEIIHTPGHTPGHICLYLKKQKILFSGDLIVGEGTCVVGPPDGDMRDYFASLERIKNIAPALILPGHGPQINNPLAHLDQLIAHRKLREIQILKLLEKAPSTAQELMEKIYIGFIHPALYQVAKVTVLGHLKKLEDEGKIRGQKEGEEKRYELLIPLPF